MPPPFSCDMSPQPLRGPRAPLALTPRRAELGVRAPVLHGVLGRVPQVPQLEPAGSKVMLGL